MSDSDWHDPFAEDEAAREREARRAERAARRREREQQARASLGDRVREELADTPPPEAPPAAPPPAAPPPVAAPPPAEPPPAAEPSPAPAAPPPRRPPASTRVRHRRTMFLLGLGALIALIAGAGVLISRAGDDDGATAEAGKARKTIEVTIPEGLDRPQIAKVAKQAGLKGNYERATRSSRQINLKKLGGKNAESLEGFLFPATYELFKRANVNALVSKQLDAFESNLAGIDLGYAKAHDLSVYDVVTVASMIEGEIAVPEERQLAASVIYNRLDADNPLGIDATIRFEDQNHNKPLLESRLNSDTPYNTHTNPGLPPGPIGNPGLASLEAAANPAETDFFYYVIKPGTCNEHAFVETEEEFFAAEAEYQAALQAEGGSPTDC